MGIRYKRLIRIEQLPKGVPYDDLKDSNHKLPVDMNRLLSQTLTGTAHWNDLRKRISSTGIIFISCGGTVIYCLKILILTAGSSTEAKLIAAVIAAKFTRFFWTK